jgi:hypothetical protein
MIARSYRMTPNENGFLVDAFALSFAFDWLGPLVLILVLLLFFISTVTAKANSQVATAEDAAVGFVYGVRGNWMSSRTNKPLHDFEAVFAGDKIRIGRKPTIGDFIGLGFYDSTTRSLRCQSRVICDSLTVPPIQKQDGWLERVVKSIRQLHPTMTRQIVPTGVRSGQEPREAVVALVPDGILDLGMSLGSMSPGNYRVNFAPISNPSAFADHAAAKTIGVTSELRTEAMDRPLTPGMYELVLSNEAGERLGKAAILAVAPSQYESFKTSFDHLKRAIMAGSENSEPAAIKQFLRTCLFALSRQPSLTDLSQ